MNWSLLRLVDFMLDFDNWEPKRWYILPSARPPQENMMTVFPAARRGSKFKHAWVWSQESAMTVMIRITRDLATYQRIDNKHCVRYVIMHTSSNDVPQLRGVAIAIRHLNGSQVCTVISREFVNEKALSTRGLSRQISEQMINCSERRERYLDLGV